MKKRIYSVFCFLFIVSCSVFSYGEKIIAESNCEVPCWNGITPGVTTETEMLKILNSLAIINKESILPVNERYSIFDNSYIVYAYPSFFPGDSGRIRIEIFIKGGVVELISFGGTLNTSIESIERLLGEPLQIDTDYSQGDTVGMDASIINQEIGYRAGIAKLFHPGEKIESSQKIGGFSFFNPALFKEMVLSGLFSDNIHNWDGFGDIYQKYPLPK